MLSAAGRTQLLYGIVQDGLLPVGKFDGVVDFGCTVYQGESFRALRRRHYRLDTKNLTSLLGVPASAGTHTDIPDKEHNG